MSCLDRSDGGHDRHRETARDWSDRRGGSYRLPSKGKAQQTGLATDTAPATSFATDRCQLSFRAIDPALTAPNDLKPRRQNDGVHRLQASDPVSLAVYGFDAFVSYAYLGGTQLKELLIQ